MATVNKLTPKDRKKIEALPDYPVMLQVRRVLCDYVIEYNLTSDYIAEKMLHSRLSLLRDSKIDWDRVIEAAKGLSHSYLTRTCEHVTKNAILRFCTNVETTELEDALKECRCQFKKS